MKYLIGIDEAGRGPLAGPVAVGVFLIKKENKNRLKVLKKAKDSKVLIHEQREEIFTEIEKETKSKSKNCSYEVGFASAQYIDKYGIVLAIKSAMKKALKRLKLNPKECEVLLDGSLKAPIEYKDQRTIIKGDAKVPVISAASICAKVLRDRYMVKVSKKAEYKKYNFEIHKGYGTLDHITRIKKYGLCAEHRRSFLRNLLK